VGLIGGLEFAPGGKRLAITLNTATSPSDAYVLDLGKAALERWTRSEVGGLDTDGFTAPTLVRYPTFDQVDGQQRTIPAFYYRPGTPAPAGGWPVVISIHGGPESQARPGFNASTQFLLRELGVAVLVPNVRGSSGYGKTYLGPPRPAPRRVRRRTRPRHAGRVRTHLAAEERPPHQGPAVRRPGPQRPARALHRGRADRHRGAGQRPAGLVPDVQRRRPRLSQEEQQRLLRRGLHPVLAAAPAG